MVETVPELPNLFSKQFLNKINGSQSEKAPEHESNLKYPRHT
jgi:hypothetical protein